MSDELLFFESPVDTAPGRVVRVASTGAGVTQRVRVISADAEHHKTAHKITEHWTWRELRDYVAEQIIKRFGVFPRDDIREAAIFKAFTDRWGIERARAIAEYAYETLDGRWKGAPVGMNRFCKNSDSYFSDLIAKHLART